MLVSLAALSNAQQKGVGINTTTPATTLDVVADATPSGTTIPDGVLVPRMTLTVLKGKDAAYIADQNGALVFVNDITGGTTAKTVNVTAIGFYYYDSASATWKALGGGSAVDTSIYSGNGTLSSVRTVDQNNQNLTFNTGTAQFIVNGTNNLRGGQYMAVRVEPATNFAVGDNDYMIHWTSAAAGVVTLPAANTVTGREICFFAENNVLSTGALGNGGNVNPGFGTCIISNGTQWITKNSY